MMNIPLFTWIKRMMIQTLNIFGCCHGEDILIKVSELTVAKSAYEFGKTVAQEADAALGSGMHEWSIGRQNSYLDYMTTLVEAIHSKPIPDLPATHPISVMRKLLKEMTSRPVLDLPETSVPGSELTNPTSAGFNDK